MILGKKTIFKRKVLASHCYDTIPLPFLKTLHLYVATATITICHTCFRGYEWP